MALKFGLFVSPGERGFSREVAEEFGRALESAILELGCEPHWHTTIDDLKTIPIPDVAVVRLNFHQHASNMCFVVFKQQINVWKEQQSVLPYIVYRPAGHLGGDGLYTASGADNEFYFPVDGTMSPAEFRGKVAKDLSQVIL